MHAPCIVHILPCFVLLASFYHCAMTQADKEMDGNLRDDEAR